MSRNLTVVIKTSKLCNLRCRYCYEYQYLSNRNRLPIASYAKIFSSLLDIESIFSSSMKICWHGGEPLLIEDQYYQDALATQELVLGKKVKNIIQTNLYHLNETNLRKLARFDHISISFDVFGEERVDISGRNTTNKVVMNMDKLRELGLSFGAIAVISRANLADVDRVFDFYNKSSISCRVLPYYRQSSDKQTSEYGLSSDEVRECLLHLLDRWFEESNGFTLLPIQEYIDIAVKFKTENKKLYHYRKRDREHVIIIDADGSVYANGTAFDKDFCYGNILHHDARQMIESPGRARAIERADSSIAQICSNCLYYGFCPGFYIGEQTDIEKLENSDQTRCPVAKPCIDRAVEWLESLGLPAETTLTNNVEFRG